MKSFIKNLLVDVLIAAAVAGAILYFVRPTIVQQTSMQDTLQPNDYLIMYKRAYSKNEPQRGDIIIFKSNLVDEKGKEKLLIKRVIGLPGDTVSIKGGDVYLNGEIYEEDYLKDGTTNGYISDYVVPSDSYFCMGDNRLVSMDSRSEEVGSVDIDQIEGKAVLRLFPFNKIGKL